MQCATFSPEYKIVQGILVEVEEEHGNMKIYNPVALAPLGRFVRSSVRLMTDSPDQVGYHPDSYSRLFTTSEGSGGLLVVNCSSPYTSDIFLKVKDSYQADRIDILDSHIKDRPAAEIWIIKNDGWIFGITWRIYWNESQGFSISRYPSNPA